MTYLTYLNYVLLAAAAAWIVYVLRGSRVAANLAAMERFFVNMDVVAHGQRYRGDRSRLLVTLAHGRHSAFGYEIRNLCETKSGRCYIIHLQAEFGAMTGWFVTPVSGEEADVLLAERGAPPVAAPVSALPDEAPPALSEPPR